MDAHFKKYATLTHSHYNTLAGRYGKKRKGQIIGVIPAGTIVQIFEVNLELRTCEFTTCLGDHFGTMGSLSLDDIQS